MIKRLRSRLGTAKRRAKSRIARAYRASSSKLAMRLLGRPDLAIACAFETGGESLPEVVDAAMVRAFGALGVSPERTIANFYQGAVLFGDSRSSDLFWRTYPERAVITKERAKIPKRLRTYMNRREFEIRMSQDFEGVLAGTQREEGTWISEPLAEVYRTLWSMGYVETVETYRDDQLVGGLWGLRLGSCFGLMSMFHRVDRAGATALATLVAMVQDGVLSMIDCGKQNPNFARYGAESIPREKFIELVVRSIEPIRPSSDEPAYGGASADRRGSVAGD